MQNNTNYSGRTNKRKALNYILKHVESKIDEKFIYVTLSSDEILDVNDVLTVFDENQIHQILAYERDMNTAVNAENSAIAEQFEGRIKIINDDFPNLLGEELENYEGIQKIIFFDGVEWFCNKKTSKTRTQFQKLLTNGVLGHKDIYIISSSVAHRSWGTIKEEVDLMYGQYCNYNFKADDNFSGDELETMLKENTVDLNVEIAIRNCNSYRASQKIPERILIERLGKIRYNDTSHTEMDLLGFHFVETKYDPKNLKIPFKYDKIFKGTRIGDEIWEKFVSN
jgi:hypothetical protein